jgi:hypothetical protein
MWAARASVSADGEVLVGNLEPRALQFVREWAALRRKILANWKRARRKEPLLGIDPLAEHEDRGRELPAGRRRRRPGR